MDFKNIMLSEGSHTQRKTVCIFVYMKFLEKVNSRRQKGVQHWPEAGNRSKIDNEWA